MMTNWTIHSLPYVLAITSLYVFSVWSDAQSTYRAIDKGYIELNSLVELTPKDGLMHKFLYLVPIVAIAALYEHIQIGLNEPTVSFYIFVQHKSIFAAIASIIVTISLSLVCTKIYGTINNLSFITTGYGPSDLSYFLYKGDSRKIYHLITVFISLIFIVPMLLFLRIYLLEMLTPLNNP